MTVLTGRTAYEPVIGALGLTCCHDIAAWLSLQVFGIIPVDSHILDELEGIHVLLVVVDHICCHLKWAVHCNIESQLTSQC